MFPGQQALLNHPRHPAPSRITFLAVPHARWALGVRIPELPGRPGARLFVISRGVFQVLALILRPGRIGDHHLGRMDLVNGGKLRVRVDRRDGEAAVAGDRLAVVIAAEADVEARAFADRNAAAAPEEAVREPAQADRASDLDGQRIFLMMMSSSAWLPTMKS